MSSITIRPVIPDDANAIAELWNPMIRDSAFTFTSAQKTVSGLTQQIKDCNQEGRGFFFGRRQPRAHGVLHLFPISQWSRICPHYGTFDYFGRAGAGPRSWAAIDANPYKPCQHCWRSHALGWGKWGKSLRCRISQIARLHSGCRPAAGRA